MKVVLNYRNRPRHQSEVFFYPWNCLVLLSQHPKVYGLQILVQPALRERQRQRLLQIGT